MFITLNRIDDRNQQDFMQSGAAELLPKYRLERIAVVTGQLVYQDLNQSPGFSSFSQAVAKWQEYGGAAQPKILTSLLALADNHGSQIGDYANRFMVRMQGYLKLSVPGTWTLYCNQDDILAARMATAEGYHGSATSSVEQICTYRTESAGWVEFDMVFQENSGNQYYRFYIKGPMDSAYRELLPADVGYSPKLLAEDYVY